MNTSTPVRDMAVRVGTLVRTDSSLAEIQTLGGSLLSADTLGPGVVSEVGPAGAVKVHWVSADLDTWVSRHLRWADLEARQMMQQEKTSRQVRADPFGNPIERKRWLRNGIYNHAPLFLRALLYWFYRYFLRLGFLDGKEGFIFHFLQGLWFRLLVDVKLDQMLKTPAVEMSAKKSDVGSQTSDSEKPRDATIEIKFQQELVGGTGKSRGRPS